MTRTTVILIWTWHILAGALGVLLSLGAFYQWLERILNQYKKLVPEQVVRIVNAAGHTLTAEEQAAFIESFNRLTDMGKLSLPATNYREGAEIWLTTGERYYVTEQGKFVEVMRIKRNGRKMYFRLYDDPKATSAQSEPRE